MKKLLFLFLLTGGANAIWADSFQVGDLYYNILTDQNNAVEVTYQSLSTDFNYYGLTNANIPDSITYQGTSYRVTSIGDRAFSHCSSLSSVSIPASITSIEHNSFFSCDGLTSITVAEDNMVYDCRNSCHAIIETATNTLIVGSNNSVIPDDITSIGEYAFIGRTGLSSVTIPNSLTSIGSYAFWGCSALSSVTIPNSLTSIGSYAFWGCSGLITIAVDSENLMYDSRDYCNAIIETATNTLIVGCRNSIIPNSVTSIGDNAFYHIDGLKTITISKNIDSIGNGAFSYCSGLSFITCEAIEPPTLGTEVFENVNTSIPLYVPNNSITLYQSTDGWKNFTNILSIQETDSSSIAEQFQVDSLLYQVIPEQTNAVEVTYTQPLFIYGSGNYAGLKTAIIPSTVSYQGTTYRVTRIGEYAFCDCSSLTSVTIPTSVTSIGNMAFCGCSSLSSVTIPSSVMSMGYQVFDNCISLTSITIPNSLSSIEACAFSRCSNLTTITIPNSVTRIGCGAFSKCTSLTSIMIPNSMIYIEEGAFEGCSALTSITLPNSVTTIGSLAFVYCSSMTSITIGQNVERIDDSAFGQCYGLTSITCEAVTPPSVGYTIFYDVNTSIPLYVPAGSIALYKAADQWKDFSDIRAIHVYNYNVNVIADHGHVNGTGTYPEGTQITLTAVPDEGFEFQMWSDGTTTNPKDLTVTCDTTLRALFYMPDVNQEVKTDSIGTNSVTITWDTVAGATLYELRIYKNGLIVATYHIDAANNIIDEYFHSPERIIARRDSTGGSTETLQVEVGGLEPGQDYTYSLDAMDDDRNYVGSQSGSFTTEEAENGLEILLFDDRRPKPRKILQNGHLYIELPDGTRYSPNGALLQLTY